MTKVFTENKLLDNLKKLFESCNVNFLIGSGASIKAINSLGNLENELTMLIRDYHASQNEEIKIQIIDLINSFLLRVKEPNEKLLSRTFTEDENIVETNNLYKSFLKIVYDLLLNRGSNQLPKKINMFTTNYDLFMENALEELRLPYNDGGIGNFNRFFSSKNFQRRVYKLSDSYSYQYEEPVINLIKLHGSINWSLDNESDSILIANKITINDLNIDCVNEYAYIKEESNFPIIIPTNQKFVRTLMEHIYYDLSRLYSNELEREQSVLFCFGFSFEDEHIRSITKRVLGNPHLTLIVFPFSYEDEQNILEHFSTQSNVKVIRVIQEIVEKPEEERGV